MLLLLDTTLVPDTDSLVVAMEVFLLVAKEVAGAMEVLVAAMLGGKNWGCPNPVISGGRNTPPAPVAMELVAVETVGRDVCCCHEKPWAQRVAQLRLTGAWQYRSVHSCRCHGTWRTRHVACKEKRH